MVIASKIKSGIYAWLCVMVVMLGLAENRARGFFEQPQPAPGVFEAASPASIGENYDAWQYDASGYAVAPKNVIPDGRVGHIFRKADGHLPDTPANRRLLQDVADDSSTTLGTDKWGNTWSARTLDDGTQAWTQTRNGDIINGGLNPTPRPFNPETGLSAPTKPGG